MARTALTIIEPEPESAHERARRLQAEALTAALDIADDAIRTAQALAEQLGLVAELESVPAALRDRFHRFAQTIVAEVQGIAAMRVRASL